LHDRPAASVFFTIQNLITLPHYMTLASRASRALVMHQVTFRELWQASMMIEPLMAQQAADHITDLQLKSLENNVNSMSKYIEDIKSVLALDVEFHNLLAESCGNRVLMLAREPLSLLFEPAGNMILPRIKTQQLILDAHCAILDLLRKRNGVGASEWMTRHIADFKRGFEKTGFNLDTPLELSSPILSK